VGASFGIAEGDLGETADGRMGIDGAIYVENTAVTVVCVLAETDVAGDVKIGVERSKFLDGLDNGTIWVIGERAGWVLERAIRRV
jgi:hypothetical protein